jgi:hypothetical protein
LSSCSISHIILSSHDYQWVVVLNQVVVVVGVIYKVIILVSLSNWFWRPVENWVLETFVNMNSLK